MKATTGKIQKHLDDNYSGLGLTFTKQDKQFCLEGNGLATIVEPFPFTALSKQSLEGWIEMIDRDLKVALDKLKAQREELASTPAEHSCPESNHSRDWERGEDSAGNPIWQCKQCGTWTESRRVRPDCGKRYTAYKLIDGLKHYLDEDNLWSAKGDPLVMKLRGSLLRRLEGQEDYQIEERRI